MFVMGILLNVILLQFVGVVVLLPCCCFCFDARYKSNVIDITDINNISINRNNNIVGGSIVVDVNNNNNNNNNNINDNITSINNIHNKINNTINNKSEIASRSINNIDTANIIISNNNNIKEGINIDSTNKNIQHIHYQTDHGRPEISNESKLDDGRNIVARNEPVIYVETIFKAAYRPSNNKQIVNLSGLRNNNNKIRNESKPNAIETTIDSITSRSSTYRLFKKHVQFFTPLPLVVLNISKVETTTQQSENRNIVFKKFDDVGWEQRMIEWEAKLAGLTTERGNHTETRQLNLYRYHYNHFFWHPSKSTTFWLLVISGILLSFLIIGLAAILYLCHKDHGSSKLELTEQDDDDDDESSQQNQWNNIERNSLVMELSATSKTKLLFESDDGSKLEDRPGNPKEASETSFDLRHSCQAQFQNSIFTKEEASECSRLGINSVDQISGKSLVECNYYWSND